MHIIIHRKKIALFVACVILATLLFVDIHVREIASRVYRYVYPKTEIYCYRIKKNSLPDISDATPRKGKSIFFHETSCNSYFNGKITIGARQACAVESAARMNPNFDVYLLYVSPGQILFEDTESDRILKALMSYTNVKILHLDYEKYTKGTPVEELYQKGSIESSYYALSHASDVLRYLTMWKYGGIYLDLDVIVIKSLEDLPPNFTGSESETNVAAGVMGFAPNGIGHHLARTCLYDLKDNFDGHDWGSNGPGVITRLMKSLCETDEVKNMAGKECKGFTVYPTDKFYAVPWWKWRMYFDEGSTENVFNLSANSYVVHVWNKHSEQSKVMFKTVLPSVQGYDNWLPRNSNSPVAFGSDLVYERDAHKLPHKTAVIKLFFNVRYLII